ncbi:hypothetical protein PVK06_001379 [Gossypium arboreum]|uniref:Zinc finger GRF-type domain-containing protein n=1 Tax=Gossypium arboreum TaxID=29729 RepID=A0ABR0R133_GOSAR|nr:hypothetical protein PVK06_001379 [Gossypium arboreum]
MEKFPYSKLVSSSRGKFVYDEEKRRCFCNKLAPRETLWSDLNLGRRYYGCSDFWVGGYEIFKCYDNKMCNRVNEVIRELRDSKRKLAKEKIRLRKKIIKCGSGEMFENDSRSSNVEMSESGSVQNVGKDNQTKR